MANNMETFCNGLISLIDDQWLLIRLCYPRFAMDFDNVRKQSGIEVYKEIEPSHLVPEGFEKTRTIII